MTNKLQVQRLAKVWQSVSQSIAKTSAPKPQAQNEYRLNVGRAIVQTSTLPEKQMARNCF